MLCAPYGAFEINLVNARLPENTFNFFKQLYRGEEMPVLVF